MDVEHVARGVVYATAARSERPVHDRDGDQDALSAAAEVIETLRDGIIE